MGIKMPLRFADSYRVVTRQGGSEKQEFCQFKKRHDYSMTIQEFNRCNFARTLYQDSQGPSQC
jgi:hypothetical protein